MDLIKAGFKLFGAKTVGAVVTFAGTVVVARELGAGVLGSFFLFQAVLGILATPADFGLRAAVEKRLSEGEAPDEVYTSGLLLKLAPLAVVVAAILVFRSTLNSYFGVPLAYYLAATLVLQELADLSLRVLRGELRVGETYALQFLRDAGWVVIGVPLLAVGLDVYALVYGLLLSFVVTVVWGASKTTLGFRRPTRRHASSLWSYAKFDVVSGIGKHFYSRMDLLILAVFLPKSAVSSYEIAWLVTMVVILAGESVALTIFPQVSEWSAQKATDRIESILPVALTPGLLIAIPAFAGTALFSREILGIVFGEAYTVASVALVILMGEKVIQTVHLVFGRALRAIDHADLSARATTVAIVVNVVLNVVLIAEFGLVGAAIATSVSFGLNTVLHAIYLNRFVTIELPLREAACGTVAALGMAGLLLGVKQTVTIRTVPVLLAVVGLGAVTYFGLLLLFRPIREDVLVQVRHVLTA
ncbi:MULTISPECIES: polysaccharide biosynthesis C-terminal domain-containing protein [Halorussus]|uniref:oligosaccharide flippase family protein n=1 Tax=Halorussus TaxID=1070314 RepID=UPI0020A14FED|nr:polysaccharide biosynthesis C-terminal domain-containing protein [Halorussus vallis]USZ78216.1 polysaccharide biosynthesis C-terminal domain-containing protein [Halorussus vallis]